jgi:MoaA/NifB/PqqE/SkfB family radical SAM enzyme
VQSAFKTLYAWGVRIVIIEGGEPFLWHDGEADVRDVVQEARKRFFSVGVTTNGTFPIEVDADVVWVSLDGLPETHDRIRGKSFARIMAHIAQSEHRKLFAHVTINALNWEEIPALVEFLSGKVRGITVQFHYPYEQDKDPLFLSFDRRRQVLDRLIEKKRQGFSVVNSYASLEALKENRWKCQPWMIASVDPDAKLTRGCYVQNRGRVSCERCGFSAHTELSLAYGGVLESIRVGNQVFFSD